MKVKAGGKKTTMIRRGLLKTTLLILTIPSGSTAMGYGPGEAAGGSQRGQAAAADFKVLIWYNRDDALGTFQYQVYDLRKGEYSAAVDAWIKDIPAKYPAYIVLVRDVDLTRVKGETEKLKVGSVIKNELMVAAAMSGVTIGEGLRTRPGPTYQGPSQAPRVNRSAGLPQTDRSFLNQTHPHFPVPVPYPRPHP
jgi:hypothetical protein